MILKGILTFFIPLLYFLAIFIILQTGKELGFGLLLSIVGLIMAIIGLVLWILAFIKLGTKSFAVLPRAKALETGGIYKYFRHPLYVGLILTFVGLSLGAGSLLGIIYTIIVILPLSIVRAKREEKILIKNFGKEYLDYKKRTKI